MSDYTLRLATLADVPVIVYQRRAMFTEMGVKGDYDAMDVAFARWLRQTMADQFYLGWLAETAAGEIAAGSGLNIQPRSPSPTDLSDWRAYIYNVYTEPAHRRRGLARRLMETMHHWCRQQKLKTISLHASEAGRPLYESLGYTPTHELALTLEDIADAVPHL